MNTKWSELFKIRLGNPSESADFHDIVKILVVRKIIRKAKRKSWLRVYTEFNLNNGSHLKPDICVEHLKEKSVICYELQKEYTPSYVRNRTEKYSKVNIPYFNTVDLIIIPLKSLSHNLEELNKQLDEYIF